MSGLRVLKFGGSSLGDAQKRARVADLCAAELSSGPVAVVVSAIGDTTDDLLEAAACAAEGNLEAARATARRVVARAGVDPDVDALGAELHRLLEGIHLVRERSLPTLDSLLSFGERLSATALVRELRDRGLPASRIDAREWLATDNRFGDATVDWPSTSRAVADLWSRLEGMLVVTTGFIGRTRDGRTTTLGRNGSDYTATLLGRALGAREVQIWTDVAGVYSADPALVPEAHALERLSYMEAIELANFGARMFHPRTMIPLVESGIPLRIRSTLEPEAAGTLVSAAPGDRERATSVTSLENLAILGIECRALSAGPSIAARALEALRRAGTTVWTATQAAHGQALSIVVPNAQRGIANAALAEEFALELARGEVDSIRARHPVTLLTLVADAMGETPNVAGRLFSALGHRGINVHAMAGASRRSVSCCIDAVQTAEAVRTVHGAFHFGEEQVSLVLYGKGVVGGQLLEQIARQRDALRAESGVLLQVIAIRDRSGVRCDFRGLPGEGWSSVPARTMADETLFDRVRALPTPVLVDCTAEDGMERVYEAALCRGIHVVGANKKPLTVPWPTYGRLMATARHHHRAYHYETTVGASLPVIGTLKNLVRTGDRVRLVEGSLSGSLGYLAHEVMNGTRLSRALARARELGYTEPRPQDDLSGLDVARKALILARELGLPLSLEDVTVEPLVPEELLAETSTERLFTRLGEYDESFERSLVAWRRAGKTLRYLARVDPDAGTARVGPVAVDAEHPAAHLRGAEALVAFTTDRYRDDPLIVRGVGAGGAVTAAGVLADICTVAAQRSHPDALAHVYRQYPPSQLQEPLQQSEA